MERSRDPGCRRPHFVACSRTCRACRACKRCGPGAPAALRLRDPLGQSGRHLGAFAGYDRVYVARQDHAGHPCAGRGRNTLSRWQSFDLDTAGRDGRHGRETSASGASWPMERSSEQAIVRSRLATVSNPKAAIIRLGTKAGLNGDLPLTWQATGEPMMPGALSISGSGTGSCRSVTSGAPTS